MGLEAVCLQPPLVSWTLLHLSFRYLISDHLVLLDILSGHGQTLNHPSTQLEGCHTNIQKNLSPPAQDKLYKRDLIHQKNNKEIICILRGSTMTAANDLKK